MLRNWLKSPLVSTTTALALAAGGVAVLAPAADAATPHRQVKSQRALTCESTDASVSAARKAVRKAQRAAGPRSAKVVRAKRGLATVLAGTGLDCLASTSIDDLLAMLPVDVSAQVSDLLDTLGTVLDTASGTIPSASIDQLNSIISQLTSLDADGIVSTLSDIVDQLQATGGDPAAIAGVLDTVLAGLPSGTTGGADVADVGSTLSDLLDTLQGIDFTGAFGQIRGHLDAILGIFDDLKEQVVAAVPELGVLVGLFDQLGFGDLASGHHGHGDDNGNNNGGNNDAVTSGFGSILSGLLGSTGGNLPGLGSLLGAGNGLMNLVSHLIGSGTGLLGGLFGGLTGGMGGVGGQLGDLFGSFTGGSSSGGGILGNLLGGGGLFGKAHR